MKQLSIVIPTYNERENIEILCERIFSALKQNNIDGEVIIIDDNSPDGTAHSAEYLSTKYSVRPFIRRGKKGLGSAIIDGISLATAPIVCVIDADLSHPPEAIPEMFKIINKGEAQLVIGSRKVAGGGTSEWIWYRKIIHWVARSIGSFLTPIRDLTSGFFMFDKKILEGVKLEPKSWKIGLEIMVKGKHIKAIEYPIVFVEREAGKSKMGSKEVVAYLMHLLSLAAYKIKKK